MKGVIKTYTSPLLGLKKGGGSHTTPIRRRKSSLRSPRKPQPHAIAVLRRAFGGV